MTREDERDWPAYFERTGRWARFWHPLEWHYVKHERRVTTYITEGVESSAVKRLVWRSTAIMFYGLAVIYVGAFWVPDWARWLFSFFGLYLLVYRGATAMLKQAQSYRSGWVDGRMQMVDAIFDPEKQEDGTVIFNVRMENLFLETQRDAEVVLGARTARAPDDISGLDEEGA